MGETKIFERLREFRKYKKITAVKMAEILGKSPSGYGAWETGRRNLPLTEIVTLFRMGCNLNWLIAGEGQMTLDEKTNPPSESVLVNSLAKSLESSTGTAQTATNTAQKLTDTIVLMSEQLYKSEK